MRPIKAPQRANAHSPTCLALAASHKRGECVGESTYLCRRARTLPIACSRPVTRPQGLRDRNSPSCTSSKNGYDANLSDPSAAANIPSSFGSAAQLKMQTNRIATGWPGHSPFGIMVPRERAWRANMESEYGDRARRPITENRRHRQSTETEHKDMVNPLHRGLPSRQTTSGNWQQTA